jgi:hypothetical protein
VNAERKDNAKLPVTNGNRLMRKRKTGIELKNDFMEYLLFDVHLFRAVLPIPDTNGKD